MQLPTLTIPKTLMGQGELVILPRRALEELLAGREREADVLRWSREAKKLKKAAKLPILRSLKDLR